jgi:hypothetical protein
MRQKGLILRKARRDEVLFYLIKDDDLAVISNRPFLGDRGRRPSFLCVSGVVSTQPLVVGAIREQVRRDSTPGEGKYGG